MTSPIVRPAEWSAYADVPLLHTIASAVIGLADVEGLDSFHLPYPAEAQRALDRLVLACLLRGVEQVPAGVPDLLSWCRTRPLEDWPLELPPDAFGPDDYLIDPDAGMPTQLCHEWWIQGRDTAAAQFDQEVLRAAIRLCRLASSPESYSAFRHLLVNRPVLTAEEQFEVATDLVLDPVRDLIERCYLPVPASYQRDGSYTTCGRCLTLLTPLPGGGWWCERDRCRRHGSPPLGREFAIAESGGVHHLARPLRQFVTGPGRAEVSLQARLRKLGLDVEMWPGFDAYDLRITFPDEHVWAVDVKDWKHPGLLGRAARPVPADPPYDQACWAVPLEQAQAHRDYLGTFYRNRAAGAAGLPLLTDRQLTELARARLHGDTTVYLAADRYRNGAAHA
jgi:hypothetical protein